MRDPKSTMCPERLRLLKECTASGFVNTNPSVIHRGEGDDLVQYIDRSPEKMSNKLKVKHIRWYENNSRCALQWDMVDIGTFQTALNG